MLEVRAVAAGETRPLREQVLRPGRPPADSIYPGDDDPATVHFAVYDGDRLVGIASLYRQDRAETGASGGGWRLRGMASAPNARRSGVGRALLDACLNHVAAMGGGELWCNARTPVAGFYARAGFDVISEPFEVPGIGPHVVMRRVVPSPTESTPLDVGVVGVDVDVDVDVDVEGHGER